MEKRESAFQRNLKLEELLNEINTDLDVAEKLLVQNEYKKYPIILLVGAPRSGSTLLIQWLANLGEFTYPTNLLSRFYNAPIIGAKIQRLLLDPEYNFRNEISDFSKKIDYSSQNGKTKGALAPNEFWYFWRRFFPYEKLSMDYMPDSELTQCFDRELFIRELMGVANVFEKPIAMKGMIANYNIGFLNEMIDRVIFIHTKRNPYTNVASLLETRKRQFGDEKKWYSFRIPEMKELLKIENPIRQVAGQIYSINHTIEMALEKVADERKLVIEYEEFCHNPESYYFEIRHKLQLQKYEISPEYIGEKRFEITKKEIDDGIKKQYDDFVNSINGI